MASDASLTVIGRAVTIRGDISGTGDVQIEGALEGSIAITGARITVGPEATVRATLNAREIVVHGRVEGDLRATDRAELRAHSAVNGNVFAPRLAIEDNAALKGQVDCTPVTKTVTAGPAAENPGAEPTAAAPRGAQPGAAS